MRISPSNIRRGAMVVASGLLLLGIAHRDASAADAKPETPSERRAARPPTPQPADLPDGVTQIIPRGRLAAIDDPVFVPGGTSGMPDDAWILGVVIDGEAHAYSLNLLNHHEVVNDRIGETPFAAVW